MVRTKRLLGKASSNSLEQDDPWPILKRFLLSRERHYSRKVTLLSHVIDETQILTLMIEA